MVQNARYSFLGWMRRGIAGLADGEVDSTGRLKIPLELDVIAEGGAPRSETVRPNPTVFGPGDISGIDPSAIIRLIPRNGVRDFEANFFCAVEFYDEDFPWRYTPQVPQGQALAPWIWVVALADGEWSSPAPSIIEITSAALRSAFPNPTTTAAWAHVQLDSALEGNDVAAAHVATRQLLDANPNAGCSRLVCPRRLAPATRYTAFVIPAFERGRLAGLGHTVSEIDAAPHDRPAWSAVNDVQGALQFPVYHQWSFSTSSAGDFEALARLLTAVPSEQLAGDVLVDLQEPGWNLHYRSAEPNRAQPGAVAMPTAVRVSGPPSSLAFGNDPADASLAAQLLALLSAGDAEDDDPFVLPPRYGSSYRSAALGQPGASWYEQVNLDPAYRAVAGQGAAAVRDRQEVYVDRIWDRIREALETRAATQRWQLSLHASTQMFTKRLVPVLSVDAADDEARDAKMFRALAMVAPMHARIEVGGAPLAKTLNEMPYAGAFNGGFTKITRARGPLMRRLGSATATATAPAARVRRVFDFAILVPPPLSALRDALGGAAEVFEQPARRVPPLPPNVQGKQLLNALLTKAGYAGFVAVSTAIEALRARLEPKPIAAMTATPALELVTALRRQLEPKRTIPARMRDVFDIAQPASEEAAERIDLPTFDIELPDPMYRALAEHSELIVPGLDKLPANRVTILEPDATFIDAFMLGVNHEITRELLWREVPVPLDTTIFRQFWDVRDNPSATDDPQGFRDILPIAGWGNTKLGDESHKPPAMRGALMVVVIRGDLLLKYPHTEVFMQPAAWVNVPGVSKPVRREAKDAPPQPPLLSARIAPDVTLVGFQLAANEAIGDPSPSASRPGWYVVLKERAGDVHFGLDIAASATDPSWAALPDVPVNGCVDTRAASFRALPRFGATADRIAAMLYQRPFTMFVHASRLLHRR